MEHLRLIQDETARFLAATQSADGAAPVPTCPDWTVDDLAWHLTEVQNFWATVLATRAVSDADAEKIEQQAPTRPERREDVAALLTAATASLVTQLAEREDADPAWTWFPGDATVGFTRRMQVHEATMHRIDAELAAGRAPTSIDPEVAADAVHHAITVMLAWWGRQPGFRFVPVAGVVALVASDLNRTWLVQGGRWQGTDPSGKAYDEPAVILVTEGTPAASLTGTVDALARWWWGRGPEPIAQGDTAALTAVREAQAVGMQ